ncbi:MAG: glycosyltransferase [Bacteroidetes bacterium]|nr:glycosyltransferase [Bacteroidota bacterium]
MKKIAIIIPTYNAAHFIEKAINSVLSQSYSNYEIVVVDDGSTDNTREVLEQYGDKITYIRQENQGVAIARNTGILNSENEYIAFLDSDDEWLPEKLELQISILEKNNDIGLVHTNDIQISEEGKILYIDTPNIKYLSGKISKYLLLRKASIKTSTVILRRKCLDKVGLFDPHLSRLGVEDRDLWIRFTKYYNAFYIDKPLVKYLVRSDSMSHQQEKMVAGRYYVINKYHPKGKWLNINRCKMLSAIHFEVADGLSWRGEPRKSLRQYWKALKYYPFSIIIYINFLKAITKTIFNIS